MMKDMSGKFRILVDFYEFLKARKKWWLGPIVYALF